MTCPRTLCTAGIGFVGLGILDEHNLVALLVETHFVHVRAHEQNSPAGFSFEGGILRGIGHVGRSEAFTFISHAKPEFSRTYVIADGNVLRLIQLVAVFDGVEKRLLEGEMHGENFVISVTRVPNLCKQLLDRSGDRVLAGRYQDGCHRYGLHFPVNVAGDSTAPFLAGQA